MKAFKHVLLIDDNEVDNFISNRIIAKANIAEKITLASSGIEALAFLGSFDNQPDEMPDIIFLDVRMPVMDGFDFLDELILKKKSYTESTSVVMLSSSNDPRDIGRAADYEMVKNYISKPLDMDAINTVNRLAHI